MSFGRRAPKLIVPSARLVEPAAIARPSTSSAFANSEPRIENCATTSSPAESAKSTMKSSGRLPSVDWSAPVTAGPNLAPTDSVAIPIVHATPPSAIPQTTNVTTGSASVKWRTPPTIATASTTAEIASVLIMRSRASRSPSARTSPRSSARRRRGPCRRRRRGGAGAPARRREARGSARAPGRAARRRPRRRRA